MQQIAAAGGAVVLLMVTTAPAAAQPPAPQNSRDHLLMRLTDIAHRVVALAEEFPDAKYEYRAASGVRTFSEQLRHVAFWNIWALKNARGERMDTTPNQLSKAEYPTKASLVKVLRSTAEETVAELKRQPEAPSEKHTSMALSVIAHSSEHYGQMVIYYRLNGLIPPASRSGQ